MKLKMASPLSMWRVTKNASWENNSLFPAGISLGKAFEWQHGHKYYTVHHTLPSFYKFHFKDIPRTGTKNTNEHGSAMMVINAKTPQTAFMQHSLLSFAWGRILLGTSQLVSNSRSFCFSLPVTGLQAYTFIIAQLSCFYAHNAHIRKYIRSKSRSW